MKAYHQLLSGNAPRGRVSYKIRDEGCQARVWLQGGSGVGWPPGRHGCMSRTAGRSAAPGRLDVHEGGQEFAARVIMALVVPGEKVFAG